MLLFSCNKEEVFEYPLVFTGDVINITDTSAEFTAKVSNLGKYEIIESGFIWSLHSNDNYGIRIKNEKNDVGIYSLKTNYKLLPEKTYFVRAYVQTESIISYGREVNFVSPPQNIENGKVSLIYNDGIANGWDEFIRSSFTINGIAYLAFEKDGVLYSYDPISNTFKYELSNPLLQYADLSIVYNDFAYIFSENTFYRFDPQYKTFTKLSVRDETKLTYWSSGFSIDDDIYIGLGMPLSNEYSKDFWKYNITTDTWNQVASFPGEYRYRGFSFCFDKKGYVGGGTNLLGQWPYPKFSDLWCYIAETDQWIKQSSFPVINQNVPASCGAYNKDFGYCFYQNEIYEYNPIFDIWEKLADANITETLWSPYMFTIDNKLFIFTARNYMENRYFKMWLYEK